MGQYHLPVSVEAKEGFTPHKIGAGLKAREQLYTPRSVAAALVALVSVRGGNMPADLSQSPLIGRWAGTRVLMQGDYAEDGDIQDWNGPRLSELYGAIGYDPKDPSLEEMKQEYSNCVLNSAKPGTKAHATAVRAEWKRRCASHGEFLRDHPDHPSFGRRERSPERSPPTNLPPR